MCNTVYTCDKFLCANCKHPPSPPAGGLVTTYRVVLLFFRNHLLSVYIRKSTQLLVNFYAKLFKFERTCYTMHMTETTSWHRLSDINETTRQAMCSQCCLIKITLKGRKRGKRIFVCGKRRRDLSKGTKSKHRRGLDLTKCSECGFLAINPKQIDVHHINGDHFDNEPSNLQVLCANCHRLKD